MKISRRTFILAAVGTAADTPAMAQTLPRNAPIIDDLSRGAPEASIGTSWQLFTDQVMGGVSTGTMSRELVGGRLAIRMLGDVRLENNGGFVQLALDLSPDTGVVDASAWSGIELVLFGVDQEYGMHLRTSISRVLGSLTGRASGSCQNGKRFGCLLPASAPTEPRSRSICVDCAVSV